MSTLNVPPCKTSLLTRYVQGTFDPLAPSTIGASFLAKRVVVDGTVVRLQVTNEASFVAVNSWLQELKKNLRNNIIIHIVGTKTDVVNDDPSKREVPFERCLSYAGEHLSENDETWVGMDCCHEVSAREDSGVDELFQVIARKLIERRSDIERERLYGIGGSEYDEATRSDGSIQLNTGPTERKGGACAC
ncbi:hypothetical protein TWF102_006437 [Orbilia oligospora]|uniref:Uncharacterized protein n=1 Tax=Orbilia oligospora TaxID=2813651 RepID=A0A7C8JEL6_ORBOL|nr:hypothetical protein TWF102_006437 [Orbilia oligospora]